jgi:polyisoprenoid-binding protein YceI
MNKVLSLAAAVLISTSPAFAAAWTVNPSTSKLGFSGTQTGEPFSGKFKTWTASVDFDPAKPEAAHVLVTVDMASATTGDPQRDGALPGEDWFNVSQFPKATFEITGFKAKGGDSFDAPGKLTVRGVTKDVVLPFTLTTSGDTAHAVGKVNLIRSVFGVGQGSWSTDQYVAFDVNVDIDLTAKRAP